MVLHVPDIMRKIGELFLLRTNINSVGSVLDSPVRRSPYSKVLVPGSFIRKIGGFLGMLHLPSQNHLSHYATSSLHRRTLICSRSTMRHAITWKYLSGSTCSTPVWKYV